MPTFDLVRKFATPGCWFGCQDVASAFPCLALHRDMWPLFAFLWFDLRSPDNDPADPALHQSCLYFHTHGLFGPRDWPYIWTMYMLFVTMVATASGIPLAPPYLDDVPHVRERRSEVVFDLERFADLLASLGTPEKPLKRVGPLQKCEILGRLFNSRTFTVAVPKEKMDRFRAALRRLFAPGPASGKAPLAAIQQFCGQAAFVGTVLHPAFNSYMSPIYALLRRVNTQDPRRRHHNVRITSEAKWAGRALVADIHRFQHRVSINPDLTHSPGLAIYSDACGSPTPGWGFASRRHFQAGRFSPPLSHWHINVLELLAALYGVQAHLQWLPRTVVRLYIDSQVVVAWISKGRAGGADAERRRLSNSILRELFALALEHDFLFDVRWLASADNAAADALSRSDFTRFSAVYHRTRWD